MLQAHTIGPNFKPSPNKRQVEKWQHECYVLENTGDDLYTKAPVPTNEAVRQRQGRGESKVRKSDILGRASKKTW